MSEEKKKQRSRGGKKKSIWPPIRDSIRVSRSCYESLMYIRERSRWSKDLESRLIRADKVPNFDWSSVLRGEEDDELKRYGIVPLHEPNDFVNPWLNASEPCMRLLTLLFIEGKLTYAIQDALLSVDRQIRLSQEPVTRELIQLFLGESLAHHAEIFVAK